MRGRGMGHRTDLVELQSIHEVKELPVLLLVLQLHVVLLEAVQSQLCLVVDVDLHRLRREGLLVSWSNLQT